jgi:GH24 family phage-related lysozyme (muramidase)
MKAIKTLVKKKDLAGIAEQFISMKRLWANKSLPGLLKRRDKEARLIRKAKHRYKKSDIILL